MLGAGHTEKQPPFNLLVLLEGGPALRKSPGMKKTVRSLKAVMEPEDVVLVTKQVEEIRKDL